jgi:hypothetical protein
MRTGLQSFCAALIAVSGLQAGCASVSQNADSDEPATSRTTLVVENNNWADMAVYLINNGTRARLGSAPSFSRTRFVLPDALVGARGQIRILADPIGSSQRFLSDEILVRPGQQVRLRVENNVALSSYAVFDR